MFNSRDIRSQYQTSVGFARPTPIDTFAAHSRSAPSVSPAAYPVAASFSNTSVHPYASAAGGVYLLTPSAYLQQPTAGNYAPTAQQQQQYVMPMNQPQQQRYFMYSSSQYVPQQQFYVQSHYEYLQQQSQNMSSPGTAQAQYSVGYGQLPPPQQPRRGSPRSGQPYR